MSKKKIAESIAEFTLEAGYDKLPENALRHAKIILIDSLGAMIGTKNLESSQIAAQIALEMGGPEESTIVGYKKKVASPNAAFANAIQAYGYDSIDDHNESNAHPSAATIPVSLALGEFLNKSGKELIEAIVVGNEVVCRTGTAFLGKMYYQGFHPTSTCGTFGAVISAAKLMNLNREQIINAQGIAGSMVAGLMAWNSEGSPTKRLQAAHPAMCGIIAARMAEKGYRGPSDIYESEDGFMNSYSYQRIHDSRYITDGLGKEWTFASSSIKAYPCCRYSGGHIDACLEVFNKYRPDPAQIEKILIRSSNYTMKLLAEPRKMEPKNVVDLQFSMYYQAAVALVRGKIGIKEFKMESLEEPMVKELMKTIVVVEDPEFERRYPEHYSSAVTVTLKDGRELTAVVDDPKGDKRNAMTSDDVLAKFTNLISEVNVNSGKAKEITDTITRKIETVDLAQLMELVNVAK